LKIVDEKQDGILIVTLSGRVDSASSPELEASLLRHLGSGEKKLLVDFADVEYISSAGLRVLLLLAKKLKDGGGRLVLSGMPESVRLVFELAGFLPIFAIEPSRAAGLARLAAGG
jgi:stage II sporulation protein AA (anti-sigma F factor antagonist)